MEKVKENKVVPKEIIFQGMEKDECATINEMLFKLDENQKTNVKAVEYFQGNIDKLKAELWFINSSKCKNKADIEKYKKYQENQINLSKKSLEQLEGQAREQVEQLEEINLVLKEWYDNIQMKEDEEGNRIAIYNEDYFRPLLGFATVIGYIDYSAIKKNIKRKEEIKESEQASEGKSNNAS